MSEELLDKILNLKSSKSMDEVNKSLSQIFEKIGAVETKGATHKAQNKGTCGLKAITSWFHQRMGDEMWRDFKYFYSEKELAKSAALKPEYQESFADLGAKIVEKRKAKKARKPTEVVKPEAQIAKNFPFTYFGLDPNNITVVQIDAIRDRFEALESKPITSFFSTHYESSPGTLARSAFTRVFNGLNYISDNWENSTKQTQELETFLAHAMCMLEAQKGNEQAIRGYRYIKLQEFITKAEQFLQYQYKDSKVPDDALELVKKLRNESQLDPFTVTDAQITELRSKIISQINGHVFFKNWTRMIPKEESGFNIQSFEALVAEAMQ